MDERINKNFGIMYTNLCKKIDAAAGPITVTDTNSMAPLVPGKSIPQVQVRQTDARD